ncbi:WASH complex subunit 2 isoform X1 [Aphis gossypii]|uniref:WASH complex subunit 2 isoform X1 n=1 Tax=Aphis gossypii TaxID=80765 RepID=UPI0021590C21|nr:WASH complex subunit 2 isoform X1 [Aphis gossypii]
MEDKLPSKETHVWTLSDFIERRKEWDQGDEARLAEYLQQLSNKITQGAKNTLNELDDLVASIDDTAVQIANINNEFQLLADKQFIENKVQDEDETVQTQVEVNKPVLRENNQADTLVNNIKEALKNSFEAIDTHFEKITVVVSDSDDNDDELSHEETVLRPKIFYKKLNLPSLSGNTLSEIVVDNTMFSDSDSDVEQPTNTFKDQESLSSNDVPEEDIYSISVSKNTYEPNLESLNTNNIIFEPEKPKSKNIPTYADYDEDDLFSPPPLINDDEDDNLENEYNIFGNGSNNVFGENNLWDDIDDDGNDDFSNEPPLPIYTDQPPLQEPQSNTQVKIEVPNIQQTLNDELRKRFQKDNTSSSSDNLNVTSSKIKLPKGAVNILGGTDKNPYISSPSPNIKPSTIPEISKKIAVTTQNDTAEDIKKDFNISNKTVDNSNPNSVTVAHKDLIKETKPLKKRSLFDQDSDDDDLFTKKPVTVSPTLKQEVLDSKKSLTKDKISSRNIFSESDSDEEFMDSKLKTKELVFHSTTDNKSSKLLDSSSDDDLFSNKSINKIIPKQISVLSSTPTHVEVLNKSNEIKHVSNPPIEENKVKGKLDKENIDELSSSVSDNIVTKQELLPNYNTLNSNIMESSNNSNMTIQSNQKPSNSQQTKKLSNFFSSDEDDTDDDTLFNVNKSNKDNIKKNQPVSNASDFSQNTDSEIHGQKVNLFDSSSDDDLFITNKPNYSFKSSKNRLQSSSNEIENISISKETNDCAIINKVPSIDKINQMENDIDKKSTNNFSLLSDDEDENYLSFEKNISDALINVSNNQNINEKISTISLSSEEFLSPQMDQNNQGMFQNTPPDSLENSENHDLFSQEETHMPNNENIIQNNISSILSSSDDEQKLISSPQIQNDSSNKETIIITPTLNLSPEKLLISNNQELLKEKDINASNIIKIPSSSENTIQDIKNSILSSSGEQQFSFNSKPENVNKIQEIDTIRPTPDFSSKDSIDGPFFSSPNSRNETIKKLPGKLNKNAGAFINIATLLPNAKSPLKISNIPRSVSLDEKNDALPTDGTKLFSAEKERARIQVKRRPQSRKARIAAARMSSIDVGSETNFEESSRLYVSTSNLVDYQSSPILNNDITDTDSSNEVKNIIQVPFNDKPLTPNDNDNKIYGNIEKIESKYKLTKNLFDEDSDPSESIQQELDKKDSNDNKNIILGDKLLESNISVQEQIPVIESVHKKLLENEPVKEKQSETEPVKETQPETEPVKEKQPETKPVKEKQPEIESVNEKLMEIEPISETQVKTFNVKELEENKSKISNTLLPQKSNSLFDDDDDDDYLFSRKSDKVNKPSSNIFDSDDEFDFNQKFTKKNSDKTKSIFGDDSDDDLFNSPNKPSGSNLTSQKPIGDKLNQRQNRSSGDGYVKLAAESVAVNPLEFKKD